MFTSLQNASLLSVPKISMGIFKNRYNLWHLIPLIHEKNYCYCFYGQMTNWITFQKIFQKQSSERVQSLFLIKLRSSGLKLFFERDTVTQVFSWKLRRIFKGTLIQI